MLLFGGGLGELLTPPGNFNGWNLKNHVNMNLEKQKHHYHLNHPKLHDVGLVNFLESREFLRVSLFWGQRMAKLGQL